MTVPAESSDVHTAPGKLLLSAFGPLAEAVGAELAKLPPFATRNVARVAEVFRRKRRRDDQTVSARLLKQVLDEAAWSEDEIVAEYLGGVLAASGDQMMNDQGVVVTALIRRLSALQLRAHYIFYSELLRLGPVGTAVDLRWTREQILLHLELDLDEFLEALGLPALKQDKRREILEHTVLGLARADLIEPDSWDYVIDSALDDRNRRPHVAIHPSPLGAELYLWGSGSP